MKKLDIQGHRGTRGLMPENTIPAFIKAVDLGVNTLEMDLAVTGEKQLLVSHEPYFSSEYCRTPEGLDISDSAELSNNIYQMKYAEISKFDCGSKPNSRFPEQQKMSVHKPLLTDVLDSVESYCLNQKRNPVNYNIEIKSLPLGDNVFHPSPDEFSELVYRELNGRIDWERVTIQSFDFRILQYFHKTFPDVRLAALVENDLSIHENLENLGFVPQIYSCDYVLLSRENVNELHDLGMKVIPWTVNEKQEMTKLIEWGVDGLITDYPNRYNEIEND